ncbi:hypothetical protein [Paenibacillus sp. y28]|uniref:hypothetical protein n=1 Tax=Paenibacillus sp. y28 TaxID=3129110 RepID=UPI00301B4B6F
MDKRLSLQDYVFTLTTMFLLVCVAGAFFLGLRVGTDRTEAKWSEVTKKYEASAKTPGAYDQQVLASFYDTIFLRYSEFQKKWFEQTAAIERGGSKTDPSALLKDLAKLSEDNYSLIMNRSIPETSPLLAESQQNYLKSLKLFSETLKKYQSQANSLQAGTLITQMNADSYIVEAKNFGLKGQAQFYESIVKWNETADPALDGTELAGFMNLTVADWSQMNINVKNSFSANWLSSTRHYTAFYPQDLTARMDNVIQSGQDKKQNIAEAAGLAAMLVETGAVRPGDYAAVKDLYAGETLPQLPVFSK